MNLLSSSEFAVSFLIGCSVKATLLLALTAGTAYALRRRSAAVRHHVWALGIAGSMALPLLTLLLPAWRSTALANAARLWGPAHAVAKNDTVQRLPSMVVDAAAASPLSGQLSRLALVLWVLGALFVGLKLLGGLSRLARVSARSTPVVGDDWARIVSEFCKPLGVARRVQLLQCRDEASMPLTWGMVRPRILLPDAAKEWSPDRRRAVLSHELAHIARHDWFVQICAELACSLYWFHPLVWFAAASLRNESERACDDSVLNGGMNAADYANQLLDLARTFRNAHRGWSAALAIARPTNLERRFIAMLNPTVNRGGLSRGTGLLIRIAAFCLLLPLAALRLPGQNLSGRFTGTIFDISGGAVPNATVIMTNHKENTVDMTTSNAEGNFAFKALSAGEYEMKVLKPGFAVYLAPQTVLEPGRDLSMTVKLDIGSIKDNVDVVYRDQHYAFDGQQESSAKAAEAAGLEVKPKPTRIRIGGNVEAAKVLTKVQPIYPASAKEKGAQGTVVLHAVVGMDGKPLSLQVLNSQIDPDLARAAVEAVSQWRYQPTLLNGEPVEVDTTITVNFKLLP
jgi:TonB family protein